MPEQVLKKIMDKQRAQLYNLIETSIDDTVKRDSMKQSIKDITGQAWNQLTDEFTPVKE